MIRKAFTMKVYPEQIEEYVKRHNPIWEELKIMLKAHGVHNYSIFLNKENCTLFAYTEIESEDKWNDIAATEICQKWWKHMSDLMETHADDSPVSFELTNVFYMP